jgi:putative hydrolase of the HAD superfamily
MKIDMIAFDADDTLWQAEIHFRDALFQLHQILAEWGNPETIDPILNEIELRNLPRLGYGVKAFVISMIEAAVKISQGQIGGVAIGKILALGQSMLDAEMVLKPFVCETLTALSATYRLMVITKGDLLDQTMKVSRSGLSAHFDLVEVVNEKTTETYNHIMQKYHLDPTTFFMVGNSLKSDIQPVLEIGGTAVHIPADTTWEHEMISEFDRSHERFYELDKLSALPKLMAELSQ